MANNINYAKIFDPKLDKQIVQVSTTGWMELNSRLIKYNGGKEVKIPQIVMDGLADYDRENGYTRGAVTLDWKTHELTQDRGRSFLLDANDVDEAAFVPSAGTVMGEFQRTMVVPEIDAYRYSKIATKAVAAGNSKEVVITADNIVNELLEALTHIEENAAQTDLVITMSPTTAALLALSEKGVKRMSTGQLKKGEMSFKVKTFNDYPIVEARQALLRDTFQFNDGATGGQEAGGFVVPTGSKPINFLIMAKNAPVAISKTDKTRVFTPEEYQNAHAWKIDYRKYHDLWIPQNKLVSIFASIDPTAKV